MLRILAIFIFFTRLPFWKIAPIPPAYFKNIVSGWAFAGWLTGAVSAASLYIFAQILPIPVAVLLAILSRLFITGGLHEDGLADFFDGFGGGSNRERILAIMKDSHIGSYGVIGLILYFLLFYSLLSQLPIALGCTALLAGDPFCKGVSSMIINRLPYARNKEDSKAKVIYSKMGPLEYIFSIVSGILPLFLLSEYIYWVATIPVFICWFILTGYMKRKIQGYTGDCCGATVLICEIVFYMSIVAIYTIK